MGYRGSNNFDERDKLFGAQAQAEACKEGHAWIRDWDRVFKCSRCKALKPEQSARL
jgi:hypothetical protein